MDALTCDARDDWVAAFQALRSNFIIAAVQRNDPAVTSVYPGFDAEECIALCSALVGNSNVVKWKQRSLFESEECTTAVLQMLRRNSSLLDVQLSGEMMLETLGGMQT